MINLLPEPKRLKEEGGRTSPFGRIELNAAQDKEAVTEAAQRWSGNHTDIEIMDGAPGEGALCLDVMAALEGVRA